MASHKLFSTIFILSLLACATFTSACPSCTPVVPKPKPKPPPKPKPCPPTPAAPTPVVPMPAPPMPSEKCPRDTLKLGACADLLGLVNVVVGTPASSKCCAVLEGLVDLEAAVCLCTAIKASVLGINLNIPVTLSLLLSACEKEVPKGFQC